MTVLRGPAALLALRAARRPRPAGAGIGPPPATRTWRLFGLARAADVRAGDRFRSAPAAPSLRATSVTHGPLVAVIYARRVADGHPATVILPLGNRVWDHKPLDGKVRP